MERLLSKVEEELAACQVSIAPPTVNEPETAHPVKQVEENHLTDESRGQYDLYYFGLARPELLERIPQDARQVLDIGCGAGCLGEALKRRQPARVVGIEVNPAAADAARRRLDEVFSGDVENLELPFAPGSFDAVICGDVLEHLERPEALLRHARDWLSPNGRLIASVPNVRHWTVVSGLLSGHWTYEPAGLLDDTHIRFFTRADIVDLFEEAGFRLERIDVVPGPGYPEWNERGRPGDVHAGGLHIEGLPQQEAEEFFAYQYLVVATPTRTAPSPEDEQTRTNGLAVWQPTTRPSSKTLRVLHLGNFKSAWRHEALTANALEELGHSVRRIHEYAEASPTSVLAELESGRYDCLLFYKGRIGAQTHAEVFNPTGELIAEVLEHTKVPCYTWYVDRAYQYEFQPSREAWMRRVAPLCRVAFVAETALTHTNWGHWHLLREPCDARSVREMTVPESEKQDLAFLGQIYGTRAEELSAVTAAFPIDIIEGVYGADLSALIPRYRIVLGPRFPCVSGYWGNRVYVVLGNGGFFLAPDVPGMREEGLVAGEHFAALGDDPVASIRKWLANPVERLRIAREGKQLVLSRFTYTHAVSELCRVIQDTLD